MLPLTSCMVVWCRYNVVITKTCWLNHLKAGGSLDDEPGEVCEFGCLPPRMPKEVFLSLHPVPQPVKNHPNDEHFKPFKEVWGKPEHYSDMSHCPSVRDGKTVKKKQKAVINDSTVRRPLPSAAFPGATLSFRVKMGRGV